MKTFRCPFLVGWLMSLCLCISGFAEEIETSFDATNPASQLGDVAWSLAERPNGGFLIVAEHLLDETVDSYNREALVIVTDPKGKPKKRVSLPRFTHASKIRALKDGSYLIAGNKKGHGASLIFIDEAGTILREKSNVTNTKDRPTAAANAVQTTDGGFLVACKEGLPGFVTKLTPDLKTQWTTEAIENLNYVKTAVAAPNGHCYMVGQFGGGKGIFIARWDEDGKFVEKIVHKVDKSTNKGRRIILNQEGHLVIGGMVGSGGNGHFLFMVLDPENLAQPLVQKRVDPKLSISNYGQTLIQCRDGSYVIAGRSGKDKTTYLSMVRVNGEGEIIGEPKYFGNPDPKSGEVGYDVIECRDGSIAVAGLKGTRLIEPGDITDISPSADIFLVKTKL